MIGRLRRAWRRARSNAVVGRLIDVVDRLWWIRTLSRSGLVDAEFYAAQRGWRRAGANRAVIDYAWRGFRKGLSPNPLFDEHFAGAALPDKGRVPALYAYLVSDRATVAVHPWWDSAAYCRAEGIDKGGLEHAWRARDRALLPVVVASRALTVPVRTWCGQAMAATKATTVGEAADGRHTIVRMVQGGDAQAADKISDALFATDEDTTVHLVCVSPTPSTWLSAATAARVWDATAKVKAIRAITATALQDVLELAPAADSDGAILLVEPRAAIAADQCRKLVATGTGTIVAPAVLESDGTLAGIGAEIVSTQAGPRAVRILKGHPSEDLVALAGRLLEVPLVSGRIFAAPRRMVASFVDAARVEDFDSEALSLHARRTGIGAHIDTSIVVGCFSQHNAWPESRDELPAALEAIAGPGHVGADLYRDAGFSVESWIDTTPTEAAPRLRRRSRAQRWAIKTCAPAGPTGQVWGDTHFAQGLASALRRRGHEVVVDAFAAALRPTTYLDDVHVVIRGPFRISPPDTGIRVEWIISHPDEITSAEVARFDLAFAVSPSWAQRMSAEWNVSISPLLECTDADLFFPRGLPRGDDVVFVGTARGIARPSVVAPLNAGVDVKVYGPDWRGFIPADAIAAPSIPNRDLSERYETASVVLNDHWPAMRREGFMAMRPFDAVAAGGRVISESVPLLDTVFEGAVVEYHSEEELVELLTGDVDALFPSDRRLLEISERIRTHHSFDARAKVLDEAVRNLTSSAR